MTVEMFGQTALEIRGEADIQVAVVHGEQDVNAVLEFGGHVGMIPCFSLPGSKKNQGDVSAVEASLHYTAQQ